MLANDIEYKTTKDRAKVIAGLWTPIFPIFRSASFVRLKNFLHLENSQLRCINHMQNQIDSLEYM